MKTKNKIKRYLQNNFYKVISIGMLTLIGVSANVNLLLTQPYAPEYQVFHKKAPKELPVKEYVLNEVAKAGLNPKTAEKMIGSCENKTWNPDQHAVNWDNQGGVDRGLWQINSLHHPEVSNACAYDYKCATKEAIRIIRQRGWDEWSCGKNLAVANE